MDGRTDGGNDGRNWSSNSASATKKHSTEAVWTVISNATAATYRRIKAETHMFLMHHEVLGVVDMVCVGIFNPDPEWLASLAVRTVVPLETAENLENNAQYGARYRLDRRVDV